MFTRREGTRKCKHSPAKLLRKRKRHGSQCPPQTFGGKLCCRHARGFWGEFVEKEEKCNLLTNITRQKSGGVHTLKTTIQGGGGEGGKPWGGCKKLGLELDGSHTEERNQGADHF